MSKRLFFLADGTLKTVSAGRFRGDDDVATKTITEQIVVGQVQGAGAPVHMDPDNPEGPVVIHYDAASGQQGLSVVKDAVAGNVEVFQIKNDGVGEFLVGLEAKLLETEHLIADEVTGPAFDVGLWCQDPSLAVPTHDTAIMRDADKESINMANLRVGTRTNDPQKMENGVLSSDPAGLLAPDGLPQGLFFVTAYFDFGD